MDGTDNNMRAYMEALEEERRKIQVFQRELPLCMELVTQAIEACKKQFKDTGLDSEITDKTSEEGPVLEEFIPIRRDSSSDVDEVVDADTDDDEHHSQSQIDKDKKKSDWLRSVSLWNPNRDMPFHVEEATPEKLPMGEMKDIHPTQKETSDGKSNQSSDRLTASPSGPATTTSSSAGTATVRAGGVAGKRSDDKKAPTPRKQRRCWSPELHRRFVHALQHLGGSHATPKQIRELMKVDGLTNDEVKSHLQKYRLHTRRPNPPSNSGNVPQPQFVVVGGIWVPPAAAPTAMDAATSLREAASLSMIANNRIYAPVAAPATVHRTQQRQSSRVSNTVEREKLAESKSAATSRSTHTVTVC